MKKRPFGPTDRDVATVGQGTWNIEQAKRDSVIAALRTGFDLGMNHIDTAEMYGSGTSESIIGEAIAGRRDEIYLVSKVLPQNASRAGVRAACEQSLRRLRTDRLDCYLLHWRGSRPLAETFAGFEDLLQAGKILSWGVSNFDTGDLEEAEPFVGSGGLVCNQVLYHLGERTIEHAVLPWCAERSIAVVAYSPFGSGQFPGLQTTGGRVLAAIAAAHQATSRQVALAFLTRESAVFTIPKSSNPDHTRENAGAGALALCQADIARIDAAFPRGPRPRTLPMI